MLARPGPARRVASLALIAWVGHAAFLGWMQLNLWQHYQFATWWIIPVGVAGALDWLRTRLRPLAIGVGGAAWALALAQFLFVVAWMGCIREQGGTRGIYYSATLGELKGAVERICAWPEHQLFVANRTRVFAEALNYLADVNATCAGKSIHVCPFQCQPPPPPGSRGLMLVYGKDKGGTLAVR